MYLKADHGLHKHVNYLQVKQMWGTVQVWIVDGYRYYISTTSCVAFNTSEKGDGDDRWWWWWWWWCRGGGGGGGGGG